MGDLSVTRRKRRRLKQVAPAQRRNTKVPREGWVDCARVALIEEGIGGVKIGRLAERLSVTRGGFYHHFSGHNELLEALLDHWKRSNHFVPAGIDTTSPEASMKSLEILCDRLINQDGYDPQFDLAVYEWARISQAAADFVQTVDAQRLSRLQEIFLGLGYTASESVTRARVFYYHQIGYYALNIDESVPERQANLRNYLDALGGNLYRKFRNTF